MATTTAPAQAAERGENRSALIAAFVQQAFQERAMVRPPSATPRGGRGGVLARGRSRGCDKKRVERDALTSAGRLHQLSLHHQPARARDQPRRPAAVAPRSNTVRIAYPDRVCGSAEECCANAVWEWPTPHARTAGRAARAPVVTAMGHSSTPYCDCRGRWRMCSFATVTWTFWKTCCRPTPRLPCLACACSLSA